MKYFKYLFLIMGVIFMSGCSIFKNDAMEDIDIYTTTYPSIYLINYLYGDNAKIYSIYPTGVNFKEYNVPEKKLNEYAKTDLYIFNSQDIDRDYAIKMVNINNNLKLIDSAYGMNISYGVEELWLDPYNYLMMAKNIKDSLSEYLTNPYLVTSVEEKYEDLDFELSKLDANYKDILMNGDSNIIVATNSVFKYLTKYNIDVIILEEDIEEVTMKDGMNLSDIAKSYNISVSDILTYNNKTEDSFKIGDVIKIPVKVIDSTDLTRVKKLIDNGSIKYIYTDSDTVNDTVTNLLENNKIELLTINTLYSLDGNITNNNEDYFTVMNDNLELYKKELYK